MSNDKDWKELEKWNKERTWKEETRKGYTNFDTKKQMKKLNKISKAFNITGKGVKIITILIFFIFFLYISTRMYVYYENLKKNIDFPVVDAIEGLYNIKIETISEITDEEENVTYEFQLKDNNEIKFTAIEKRGGVTEDFLATCHKYYFEKWNSPNKEYFTIEENITKNGMLEYDTHIEINSFEDVEKSAEIINEFADFCGQMFYPAWQIYLVKNNKRIYPYNQYNMTHEETINRAKEVYKNYFKDEIYN